MICTYFGVTECSLISILLNMFSEFILQYFKKIATCSQLKRLITLHWFPFQGNFAACQLYSSSTVGRNGHLPFYEFPFFFPGRQHLPIWSNVGGFEHIQSFYKMWFQQHVF